MKTEKMILGAAVALLAAVSRASPQAVSGDRSPWSIASPWRGAASSSTWKSPFDGKPFDGAGVQPTGGYDALNGESGHLAVFGRMQLLGAAENVPDPTRKNDRVYLFLREARLGARGEFSGYKYEVQTEYGGEETMPGDAALTLLDMAVDAPVPVGENTSIKIGQFRVPYSREGLTDTGYLPFSDRSIQSMGFLMGRDYGVAVQSYEGPFAGTFGVFSGGGADLPAHFIPEALGVPLLVARAGYNDGVDADIYHVSATDLNIRRVEKAAYVNALFEKDSSVGHSTILNTKYADQDLLASPSWNPYLPMNGSGTYPPGPQGFRAGDLYQVGADAVYRLPLAPGRALDFESEVNWGGYQNQFGILHEASGRLQAGLLLRPLEVDLRYVALLPDKNMGATDSSGGLVTMGAKPIHQIDPGVTWYLKGQNVKVTADAPVYLGMPVIVEPYTGSYVLSDFPNEINASNLVNPGWTLSRRTVTEARLLLQFQF